MCGFRERPINKDDFSLDSLTRAAYITAMRSLPMPVEMGPGDVFQIRTKLGLTQRTFGFAVGVDQVTVSRWERGITKVSTAYAALINQTVEQLREEMKPRRVAARAAAR